MAVAADDPLMIAWEAYKRTAAFANTKKWATDIEWIKQSSDNVDGQLWAAFDAGWRAAQKGATS
jgi:hypothetical protein